MLLFDLDLDPNQMFALESIRGGDSFEFELQFSGISKGAQGPLTVYDSIIKQVSVSDWSFVLRQLGFADILVVGLELPQDEQGSALVNAVNCIRRANECMHRGQYDVAIAQCRQALDSAHAAGDGRDLALASLEKFKRGDKTKMSKLERELLVGEALRHYTHLAHHIDSDGAPVSFGRTDAISTLALTTSAVASAINRKKAQAISKD